MKILVEKKYGHGGKIHSRLRHKFNRIRRTTLGRSSIPFDWSVGVTGRPVFNIKNQFQSSSCWGQAYSSLMQNILKCEDLSAKSAYSPIYLKGGGVAINDGINEAMKMGITSELNVPSIVKTTAGDTCTEAFIEDTTWRTQEMIDDCAKMAGFQVVNVEINPDAIAEAIRDYGGVLWLLEGQSNGTWLGVKPTCPSSHNSNPLWGHYMASLSNVRPQSETQEIDFYQSWGTDIGNNGLQTFDELYINSGYVLDCITFVPAQNAYNPAWWQTFLKVLEWIRQERSQGVNI